MPNGDPEARRSRSRPVGDGGSDYWSGSIDADLASLRGWVRQIDHERDADEKKITELTVQIAQMKTQLGVWAAVGGIIGAGIVSFLAYALGGHLG